MAGFTEAEQRTRHLEELARGFEEMLHALADQVGAIDQAQKLMRPPIGVGRSPRCAIPAVVTTEISAAPDADTLGEGFVDLRDRDGADLTTGRNVKVYSNMTSAVVVGTRVHVHPDGDGYLLGIVDCA